jgi:hypothetical protein
MSFLTIRGRRYRRRAGGQPEHQPESSQKPPTIDDASLLHFPLPAAPGQLSASCPVETCAWSALPVHVPKPRWRQRTGPKQGSVEAP